MTHKLVALGVLTFTVACGAPDAPVAETEDDLSSSRTQYVDLDDIVKGADSDAWFAVQQGLVKGFDQICGDTFCGGDFSNLYSLRVSCSVSSKVGKLRECLWSFAGSQEQVDAKSGAIASSPAFFECRFSPTGNAKSFVESFGTGDPLRAALPSLKGATIYDQLGECFGRPIGFAPLPAQTQGTFVDVQDSATGDVADHYFTGVAAAKQAFDQICGDTFCEGDYSNLQSLSLRCSQDAHGTLGSCSWTIAANDTHLDSRGYLREKGAPFVCNIPVSGTTAALANVLGSDQPTAILDRSLPGGGTLMAALGNCL